MKEEGLSLLGILLAISASMILIVGVALLSTRLFNTSRESTEQVRITEDARLQLERLSDTIRDARSVDFTDDGLAAFPTEVWLQHGDRFDIQFYANFDADPVMERVHYFLNGSDLIRGVRDPYNSLNEETVVVARSIRNIAQNVPLFRYYVGEGQPPLPMPVFDKAEARLVEITVVVDVDQSQAPPPAQISTIVVPRASAVQLAPLPSPTPTPSPTQNPVPSPSPGPPPAGTLPPLNPPLP